MRTGLTFDSRELAHEWMHGPGLDPAEAHRPTRWQIAAFAVWAVSCLAWFSVFFIPVGTLHIGLAINWISVAPVLSVIWLAVVTLRASQFSARRAAPTALPAEAVVESLAQTVRSLTKADLDNLIVQLKRLHLEPTPDADAATLAEIAESLDVAGPQTVDQLTDTIMSAPSEWRDKLRRVVLAIAEADRAGALRVNYRTRRLLAGIPHSRHPGVWGGVALAPILLTMTAPLLSALVLSWIGTAPEYQPGPGAFPVLAIAAPCVALAMNSRPIPRDTRAERLKDIATILNSSAISSLET